VTALDAIRIVAGFAIGSVPTGFLLARWASGVDVRRQGSGNIGATNVYRTSGEAAGIATLSLDAAKGALAVAIAALAGHAEPWVEAAVGLAAVLGHAYSPWLRGRGGKGVATAAGVAAALAPAAFAVAGCACALVVAATRVVSAGSLVGIAAFPAAAAALGAGRPVVGLGILLGGLVFWWHRDNLRRLRRGEEPPIRRPRRVG